MSLKNPNVAKPAFESVDDDVQASPVAATAPAAVSTVPAVVAPRALSAVVATGNMYCIAELKNALTVDYQTLDRIVAAQGIFSAKETEENLGSEVVMELLSWQDNFVGSPFDDDAPVEMVKYSDDGVTAKDGTNMAAHIAELKAAGYDKAKIQARAVVVGALLSAEKGQDLVGKLIQIDLPPSGKTQFMRHQANTSWLIKSGKMTEDQAKTVRLKAVVMKGQGKTTYTACTFASA